jgi:hypothetical protein
MRKPLLIVLPLILLTGCAGDAARVSALGPAMELAWPGVQEDALLGIRARTNAKAAAALNVEKESDGVADSRRGRVNAMANAVRALNGDSGIAEPTPEGRVH